MEYVIDVLKAPVIPPGWLAKAKHQVRVEIDETYEDSYLMDLLADAHAYVAEMADLTLLPTELQMTLPRFPRWARCPVNLPRPPLVSVDSIEYFDCDGRLQTLDGFRAATQTFSAVFPAAAGWPQTQRAKDAVRIKYTAGNADAFPRPALRAIMLLVGHWFMTREDSTEMRLEKIPHGVDAICLQLRPGDEFRQPIEDGQRNGDESYFSGRDSSGYGYGHGHA